MASASGNHARALPACTRWLCSRSEKKSRVTQPGLSFGRMAWRPPTTIVVRITKKFLGYRERANQGCLCAKVQDGARAQSSNFPPVGSSLLTEGNESCLVV